MDEETKHLKNVIKLQDEHIAMLETHLKFWRDLYKQGNFILPDHTIQGK